MKQITQVIKALSLLFLSSFRHQTVLTKPIEYCHWKCTKTHVQQSKIDKVFRSITPIPIAGEDDPSRIHPTDPSFGSSSHFHYCTISLTAYNAKKTDFLPVSSVCDILYVMKTISPITIFLITWLIAKNLSNFKLRWSSHDMMSPIKPQK